MPTFGSLFAGIGGIDLGLERAGWTCRWQVEWDGFCQNGLAKHWPDVPRSGDITTVDWSGIERVDLLAGGFPCQPVSAAGRRKAQADTRWLWPEFLRAIRDLRPGLVLLENVTNILAINDGSVFGEVVGDLAACGYDTEWDCIPAAAVGALHERDRVFVVAYPGRLGGERWRKTGDVVRTTGGPESEGLQRERRRSAVGNRGAGRSGLAAMAHPDGLGRETERRGGLPDDGNAPLRDHADRRRPPLADSDLEGLEGRPVQPERAGQRASGAGGVADTDGERWDWGSGFFGEGWRRELANCGGWLPEPPVGRLVDGLPRGLARWRVASLKALGNAVVPQVAEVIGRRLLETLS